MLLFMKADVSEEQSEGGNENIVNDPVFGRVMTCNPGQPRVKTYTVRQGLLTKMGKDLKFFIRIRYFFT